jgi:agmatine deiminase
MIKAKVSGGIMKKQSLILIMVFIMSVSPYFLIAQNDDGSTHKLTPDDFMNPGETATRAVQSGPPGPSVRSIAEFEPMEGVLIAYPGDFGIPYSLIAELSNDVIVMTIVRNASDESLVRSQYRSNKVVLANCQFVRAPLDTYYTRDYGPFFIADNRNKISIVDMYLFYAPDDDAIPATMSEVLGVDCYDMDMVIQGGNYMSDGMGIAASTSLLFEDNPSLDEESIERLAADYLNISTYHIVEDPN